MKQTKKRIDAFNDRRLNVVRQKLDAFNYFLEQIRS